MNKALPSTVLKVEGTERRVLVDTGCSRSIANISCCKSWTRKDVDLVTVSGEKWKCEGVSNVLLQLDCGASVDICVSVTTSMPLGFKFILGMDGISALGGVTIDSESGVSFGREETVCAVKHTVLEVDEKDFSAVYDSVTNSWTASWKWTGGEEPGTLQNQVKAYSVPRGAKNLYDEELARWIRDGWLRPYDEEKYGPAKGLIPLMAVVQRNKRKVRPVMDFRELNTHIDAFTADSDVCADKLREWRRQGVNVSVVDLTKAYLQVRIHESLWPYQTVIVDGQRYCLTRLGFGLNIAPMVMKAVLKSVLSQDPDVEMGTSAYIDDILVNEDVVKAGHVVEHLKSYGLLSKSPERVTDGTRVLGLRVWGEHQHLVWKRDNEVDDVPSVLSRRSVFSYCGKLVSHYPVCGWLRVATAYIKKMANHITENWDQVITNKELRKYLEEIVDEVRKNDPVRGRWDVQGDKARVWVDASSMALGVAVEVDGCIVEDASWLRKDLSCHINMAELDAVIKGLNLALAWKVKVVDLLTDSSTVYRWISDALTGKSRLKTRAASEMLIRRRVGIILSLIEECNLQLSVTLVPSSNNKADSLTRIPQRWLKTAPVWPTDTLPVCAAGTESPGDEIATIHHAAGHPGVNRTLYFVKKVNPEVTRREVQAVVTNCDACRSIDPAPVKWQNGSLDVEQLWQRVGMDITHYKGRSYLTLIDCGPSRFAIWRHLRLQTSACVIEQLEAVFCERGAPEELLTDNDTAFRSRMFVHFAERWGVRLRFRCAYVPSGNGMVERSHRTIKVIAARKECTIPEAVYLYNLMPQDDCSSSTAPANILYRYTLRVRHVDPQRDDDQDCDGPYRVGEEVWVKPHNARCDVRHNKGMVTKVMSDQAVEVDGVPRHVKHLHRCNIQSVPVEASGSSEDDALLVRVPAQGSGEGVDEADHHDTNEDRELPRRSSRIRQLRSCSLCDL